MRIIRWRARARQDRSLPCSTGSCATGRWQATTRAKNAQTSTRLWGFKVRLEGPRPRGGVVASIARLEHERAFCRCATGLQAMKSGVVAEQFFKRGKIMDLVYVVIESGPLRACNVVSSGGEPLIKMSFMTPCGSNARNCRNFGPFMRGICASSRTESGFQLCASASAWLRQRRSSPRPASRRTADNDAVMRVVVDDQNTPPLGLPRRRRWAGVAFAADRRSPLLGRSSLPSASRIARLVHRLSIMSVTDKIGIRAAAQPRQLHIADGATALRKSCTSTRELLRSPASTRPGFTFSWLESGGGRAGNNHPEDFGIDRLHGWKSTLPPRAATVIV